MNILLIGSTGFIGSHLSNFLSIKGHNVYTVSRSNKTGEDGHNHYNLAILGWDMILQQLSAFEEWIVIDLAYSSVPNTSFTDPIKDFSDNLYLVNKHLDLMKKISVKRSIYISSGGTIYGDLSDNLITETAPNFPLSPYGITKMACERYVFLNHKVTNLPVNIIRPSNIYGPGQIPFRGQGFIATALALILANKPIQVFGDGSVVRDYLFVEDFCEAIHSTIKHAADGEIYNISSGLGYSIADVIGKIRDVVKNEGHKIELNYMPRRPFDVMHNVLDNSKISSLNNWEPLITIEQGIKLSWKWIKDYYKEIPH